MIQWLSNKLQDIGLLQGLSGYPTGLQSLSHGYSKETGAGLEMTVTTSAANTPAQLSLSQPSHGAAPRRIRTATTWIRWRQGRWCFANGWSIFRFKLTLARISLAKTWNPETSCWEPIFFELCRHCRLHVEKRSIYCVILCAHGWIVDLFDE